MFKISVIIPCYNVEAYIDRCLESVMNQTIGLKHLEVIVVNDASTDHTLEKLYQWEQKFPENIMVISYEKNIRQGGARNVGLQYATGEYIGFVDADDWISENMYQLLYEKISSGEYDVVGGKFIREHYKGEHPVLENSDGEYSSICTRIYKKDLLVSNHIYFPEGIAYEDNYWGSLLKLYVKNECSIDEIVYHYFINPDSTTTKKDAAHHLERLDIEVKLLEEFKARGAMKVYHDEIERDFIQRYYLNTWYIIFTRFSYVPDIFREMKKQILGLFPNYRDNPYLSQVNKREQQLLRLLEMEHDFTVEELERIKILYLASMGE